MKYHIITDTGIRLLNQTEASAKLLGEALDQLEDGEACAILITNLSSQKLILESIEDITHYAKKDFI